MMTQSKRITDMEYSPIRKLSGFVDIAQKNGVNISILDGHIVLPVDKKERHIVLGFLDEEVYKGAFSETVFQTNSKRKAK